MSLKKPRRIPVPFSNRTKRHSWNAFTLANFELLLIRGKWINIVVTICSIVDMREGGREWYWRAMCVYARMKDGICKSVMSRSSFALEYFEQAQDLARKVSSERQ